MGWKTFEKMSTTVIEVQENYEKDLVFFGQNEK